MLLPKNKSAIKTTVFLILFLFFWGGLQPSLYGQEFIIQGQITDSLHKPLAYANIMAERLTKASKTIFALSDEKGRYSLRLLKKFKYKISVSYMGYKPYIFMLDSLSTSQNRNIVLETNNQQLDEVTIITDVAVKVTKDSIVYKTDKFITGNERKLKDLLKKLPGVEISQNGSISVMGTKVSKVLVEGNTFFGGGTKFAIENIPADAVDKVTAIKDYQKVAFMKGLTDEQKMVINIKLKQGKKNFIFGDLTAGIGNQQYYYAKSNIFYYSPERNFSFIGNINNTGQEPITFEDFRHFEQSDTGDLDLLKSSFKSFNEISMFAFNTPFTKKKQEFAALEWQEFFNKKITLKSFVVASKNKTLLHRFNHNTYFDNFQNLLEETIDNQKKRGNVYLMGKLTLGYKPKIFQFFEYNLLAKKNNSIVNNDIEAVLNNNNQFIKKDGHKNLFSIDQDLSGHYKINRHHTLRLLMNDKYTNKKPLNTWQSNNNILSGLIPLENRPVYNIHQEDSFLSHILNGEIKHYWLINNKNHIYSSFGLHIQQQNLTTKSFQVLQNDSINDFTSANFNNNFEMKYEDLYIGLQYKRRFGKWILKPGLFEHKFTWKTKNNSPWTKHYAYLLFPEMQIEIQNNNFNNIKIKYQLKSSIPEVYDYLSYFYIKDFNSIAKGKPTIENEIYHSFSFKWKNYKLTNKQSYRLHIEYKKKIQSLQHAVVINGVNSYLEPIIVKLPQHVLSTRLFYKKKMKKWYYSLSPYYFYSQYTQKINSHWLKTQSFNQLYNLKIATLFKKYPNLQFNLSTVFSNSYSKNISFKYSEYKPSLELSYEYKNFSYKMDFTQSYLDNPQQKTNSYSLINFSVFYQKNNSPLGFEFNIENVLNNRISESYYYYNYMAKEINYNQGLIAMLKIHYKL